MTILKAAEGSTSFTLYADEVDPRPLRIGDRGEGAELGLARHAGGLEPVHHDRPLADDRGGDPARARLSRSKTGAFAGFWYTTRLRRSRGRQRTRDVHRVSDERDGEKQRETRPATVARFCRREAALR